MPDLPSTEPAVDPFTLAITGDFSALAQAGPADIALLALAALAALGLVVAVGWTAIALSRRNVSADSFAIVAATLASAALLGPSLIVAAQFSPIRGIEDIILWGGSGLAAAWGGAVAGVVKRRVGVAESTLAVLLVMGSFLVVANAVDFLLPRDLLVAVLVGAVALSFAVLAGLAAVRYFERGLTWWVLRQLGLFLWLLVYALIAGPFIAMVKRRLAWPAFAAGLVIMMVGVSLVGAVVWLWPEATFLWRDHIIWGGAMVTMLVAGITVGRVGRRLGYFESYVAVLVTLAIVVVHMAVGWHIILGVGPGDTETHFQFTVRVPPGVAILGPMWERSLALAATEQGQ